MKKQPISTVELDQAKLGTNDVNLKLDVKPELALDGPASWPQVKYWAELAAKFQHASVAAQVMAGFALCELKKKKGIKQGTRSDLNLPHDAGSSTDAESWPELVEKHAGISDDTARRWMAMADGIKARWKKLAPQTRLKELMAVPPSQWNETDTKLITDSLHKVADGSTQLEFMRELGLAKQPQGAGAKGGTGGPKKKLSLSEEAALRQEEATIQWTAIAKGFAAYQDKFLVLTDADVTAQIATIEQALNARKAWLKQPLDKRDPKAIAGMFQS